MKKPHLGLVPLVALAVYELYEFVASNEGIDYYSSEPRRLLYPMCFGVAGGMVALGIHRFSPGLRTGVVFLERLGRRTMLRVRGLVPPTRARVWACLLAMAGSPGYYQCGDHVCIGGHMEHPPYPLTAYLGDVLWLSCFVMAFLLTALSDLRWKYVPCILFAFLFFTRFWLVDFTFRAQPSLSTEWFYAEFPVQAALCLYAVVGLLGFRKQAKEA